MNDYIDKKLEEKREQIVHNILSKYAKKKGLIKYEYPDGFYVFGNPDSQEFADKKHEEWMKDKWLENAYENCKDDLFQQYLAEVAQFEKYGSTNVISYGEWLEIKNKI